MTSSFLFITLLSFSGVQPPVPAAPEDPVQLDREKKELAAEVERRFLRLISLMGKLLSKEEELEESGRLQQALDRSRELKIVPRLEKIRELLEKKALEDALEEEVFAEKDLQRILLILQGEDEAQRIREESDAIRDITEQLERLQRLSGDQQENLDDTEDSLEEGRDGEAGQNRAGEQGSRENDRLSRRERDLQRKTRQLADELEREASRNQQGQQGRQQQGQQQQGQQGEQQQGEQQQGQQQQGQQGEQQQGEQQQGQQQQGEQQQRQQQRRQQQRNSQRRQESLESLRRAERSMQDAAQRLDAENLEGAIEDQEEALEELNRSEDRLREEKERLERERREKVTQVVVAKLYTILADQQTITNETKELEKQRENLSRSGAISVPGVKETFQFAGRSLARRERGLGTDAEDILRVLSEEASSVVAPEILRRVISDLENVSGRLDESDTGQLVQVLQDDVETSLRELIEALKPANNRKRMDQNRQRAGGAQEKKEQQQGQQQQQPGEQGEEEQEKKDLITPVMELRMLISAQRRVRARTARWNELGALPVKGKDGNESGKDQELRADQAKRLSEAQEALGGLTDELIQKYPIIDQFLLGMDLQNLQGVVEGLRGGKKEAGDDSSDRDGENDGSRLRRLIPRRRTREEEKAPQKSEPAEKDEGE